MKKGETLTLKAVVAPEKATNKGIKWSSSNTKVAAVDKNGKVKALQNGTATIKATAKDGSGVSASCKITVGIRSLINWVKEKIMTRIRNIITTRK